MTKSKILAFALAVVMIFSALSVSAFAAYEAPTASSVKSVIDTYSGKLNHYVDKTGATYSGGAATKWEDGNNGGGKNVITVYDGADGAAGTTITNQSSNGNTIVVNGVSYSGSQIKSETNIFTDAKDPVTNTDAIALKKYNASNYMLTCGLVKGVDYWVTKDGNTFTVVPEGTAGAYRAQVTGIDEGNNGNLQRLGGAMDLVNNMAIVSVNFRWAGGAAIDRLVEPCFSTITFNSNHRVSVLSDGTLSANNNQIPLAKLSTDRYYTVTAVYYALKVSDDRYSCFYDVYLDGICLAKKIAVANVANMTLEQITGNGEGLYGLRYFANAGVNANTNKEESDAKYFEAAYIRSIYEYTVSNSYKYNNLANSGNTIEGYDLTLGANLELNYYMNLVPGTANDATAKVTFTIGEEVVAEQKVADVTADAKGLYKFTCPVNSTQMASDIKVSIESETTEYKIYMDGVATDDYTYSVAAYGNTLLADAGTDDEVKEVVKAMLNYGAAAQTYFAAKNGTTAGELANVGCEYTEAELAAANFGTGTVTGATAGMTATLVLDTDTVIKIYKDGAFVAESEGITADKLDTDVTVGGVTVSVLTLAGKVPAGNTNFKNLANALALYSAASDAYVAYINSLK